ncbi:MAG: hypothetical protein QXI12_05150 [Candidatus Methanomethyliaceae archaeon]
MNILEVQEILGRIALPSPSNIIIVSEPIAEGDGLVIYKGLAERFSDTIVLAPHASYETPIHEILHSTFGIGNELVVELISKIISLKSRFFPSLLSNKPEYELCQYCDKFKALHTKYKDRAYHYRLMKR